MILSCNSCEKKFVVPDGAITATGRMVQCGSCGNKWKQFPVKNEISVSSTKNPNEKIKRSNLPKKRKAYKNKPKKKRDVNLYSPEYLAKKHGISLNVIEGDDKNKSIKKVSFGFYNSLILFIVIAITFSKSLHFFQNFLIEIFPFTEFYLNYFFESIMNILEIWKNLISNY